MEKKYSDSSEDAKPLFYRDADPEPKNLAQALVKGFGVARKAGRDAHDLNKGRCAGKEISAINDYNEKVFNNEASSTQEIIVTANYTHNTVLAQFKTPSGIIDEIVSSDTPQQVGSSPGQRKMYYDNFNDLDCLDHSFIDKGPYTHVEQEKKYIDYNDNGLTRTDADPEPKRLAQDLVREFERAKWEEGEILTTLNNEDIAESEIQAINDYNEKVANDEASSTQQIKLKGNLQYNTVQARFVSTEENTSGQVMDEIVSSPTPPEVPDRDWYHKQFKVLQCIIRSLDIRGDTKSLDTPSSPSEILPGDPGYDSLYGSGPSSEAGPSGTVEEASTSEAKKNENNSTPLLGDLNMEDIYEDIASLFEESSESDTAHSTAEDQNTSLAQDSTLDSAPHESTDVEMSTAMDTSDSRKRKRDDEDEDGRAESSKRVATENENVASESVEPKREPRESDYQDTSDIIDDSPTSLFDLDGGD